MPHTHVVVQGECLSAIAKRYGFGTYRTLYEHPDNAEFRKKRPNPNLLFPGDRVMIPDKELHQERRVTGQLHRFRVRKATKVLRLRILASDNEPMADAEYVLDLGGKLIEGHKTDGNGRLEHVVDAHLTDAVLHIEGNVLRLRCSTLNPIHETVDRGASGAQARLRNLGYDPGPVDGQIGRRSHGALALFQADLKLNITGDLDDATSAALEVDHGC